MHEMSLVSEIYRASRAAVAPHGEGRIERVRVAVGELSAAEPDLLVFAWEAITAGGVDSGSVLEIETRAARQTCRACGPVPGRVAGTWFRVCPLCAALLSVEGGDELDILSITFDACDPT